MGVAPWDLAGLSDRAPHWLWHHWAILVRNADAEAQPATSAVLDFLNDRPT